MATDPATLYEALCRARKAHKEALLGGSPAEIRDAEQADYEASLAYLEVVEPTYA